MQTSQASLLCPLLPLLPLLHLHFHLLFLLQLVSLLVPQTPKMCQTAVWQGHAALGQTQSLFSRLTRVWAVQPWAALRMPEEKTRKGETVWLSWGSGKTTAKEATFLCTVGTWESLLFLLLTGNSLCCSPAQLVPFHCLWAFHLQCLMFPQVVAHDLSLTSFCGCHWGQQFSSKLMTLLFISHKGKQEITLNYKGCFGFFSVDVFFFPL